MKICIRKILVNCKTPSFLFHWLFFLKLLFLPLWQEFSFPCELVWLGVCILPLLPNHPTHHHCLKGVLIPPLHPNLPNHHRRPRNLVVYCKLEHGSELLKILLSFIESGSTTFAFFFSKIRHTFTGWATNIKKKTFKFLEPCGQT